MAGVSVGGSYLNTDSGLTPVLDKITTDIDTAAANRQQLRGLAAGGVIPASASPAPTLFARLTGTNLDGTPTTQPGMVPQLAGAAAGMMPSAAPAPQPGSMPPPNVVGAYIGQAAAQRGIDPMTAIRVAQSEGGLKPAIAGDAGSSFGPFQLHYGNVASGGNAVAGLGDDFTKATGLDARDPANWQATVNFALDHAKANGWGAWHGAAKAGIPVMAGIQPPTAPAQGVPGGLAYAPGNGVAPPPVQAIQSSFGNGQSAPPAPSAAGPAAPPAPAAGPGAPPTSTPGPQVAAANATPPGPMPLATADSGSMAQQQQPAAAAPPGAPGALGAGAQLPNFQQIQAMIQNPATRQMGLQLWQTALTPKPTIKLGQGEREYDSRGNQIAANPAAPVSVSPGTALVNPATGAPMFQSPANQDLKQTGVDALGNPTYGVFQPQTGAVRPVGGVGAPGTSNPVTGNILQSMGLDTSKTGEAFLQGIDPALAGTVRAIAQGREPAPTGRERNQGQGKLITAMLNQYDPSFEAGNGPARAQTYAAYTDPAKPIGSAVNSLNTAIGHLGELSEFAQGLGNGQYPIVNAAANSIQDALGGGVAYKNFQTVLGKYTEEATKVYRGSGGTEADLQREIASLNPSMSPAQLNSVIATQGALLGSKVNALQAGWRQAMNPTGKGAIGDFPLVQPQSQAILDRVKGIAAATPGAQTAATQPSAGASSAAPVQVNSPAEAQALPPGTPFMTHDGRLMVRH